MEESKHLDPGDSMLKNPPANAGDAGDMGSIPGWGRSPEQRTRQPTPVFLPGESHGQRSLVGCSSLGFQLREPGRGTGHKESHSLGGRSWTSLISLRYGRRSLTSRYLTFYEERKGPHWKQRIEKVRKHSLRRCPWSPESPTQVSTHALSLKVWDSPKYVGGLRSPGLHPCWLAGRLRACLPSFPPLPCVCASSPHPRQHRDRTAVTSQRMRPGQQPGPEGSLRTSRASLQGAPSTHPTGCWGSQGPQGSRRVERLDQSPSGGPGASCSRPRK